MNRKAWLYGVSYVALGPGKMAPPKPRDGASPGWVTLPNGRVVSLEEWEKGGPALAFANSPRSRKHV